jgi:hypothetical protein
MLEVRAIFYMWMRTVAPEDVLDGTEDDKIKACFDKKAKRSECSIDRMTVDEGTTVAYNTNTRSHRTPSLKQEGNLEITKYRLSNNTK